VCHLGGEIKRPEVNIPRSIFISIAGIASLYLLMNVAVMGVVPWQSVKEDDKYLVSTFMEQLYGHQAAVVVTVLILCIAMSSLFAVVLGYSRVPYAAAIDGNFFAVFGRLHPVKGFPYISLLVLCGSGLAISLFMTLPKLITAILAVRIVVQFIAQCVGVVLLRRRLGSKGLPFKMWLYPVPVIVSVVIWIFLLYHNEFALYGGLIAAAGVGVYFIKKEISKQAQ
jgi:amino acid transporter